MSSSVLSTLALASAVLRFSAIWSYTWGEKGGRGRYSPNPVIGLKIPWSNTILPLKMTNSGPPLHVKSWRIDRIDRRIWYRLFFSHHLEDVDITLGEVFLLRDGLGLSLTPDNNISISSNSDAALLREDVEKLGCSSWAGLNKPLSWQWSTTNTFLNNDHQPSDQDYKRWSHTCHRTIILSSTPVTPLGISWKLSLPRALCWLLYAAWWLKYDW